MISETIRTLSANEQFSIRLSNMTSEERYEYRRKVYEETKNCVRCGNFLANDGNWQEIRSCNGESVKFVELQGFERKQFETVIKVYDGDCLDAGIWLKGLFRPVVLNMASNAKPGGGVDHGAGAQEESLFRRSDYFLHLPRSFYPINGAIYSPNVTVFRQSEANHYAFMDKPEKIAMIACAAPRHPNLRYDDSGVNYTDKDLNLVFFKIRLILSTALHYGHDAIVLSAFGCGAYRNPPQKVAEIFNQVLKEEFAGCFKIVVFAIFNDHNSRKNGSEGNVKPFERVFNTQSTLNLNDLI